MAAGAQRDSFSRIEFGSSFAIWALTRESFRDGGEEEDGEEEGQHKGNLYSQRF